MLKAPKVSELWLRPEDSLPPDRQYDNVMSSMRWLIEQDIGERVKRVGELVEPEVEFSVNTSSLLELSARFASIMSREGEEPLEVRGKYYRGLLFAMRTAKDLQTTSIDSLPLTSALEEAQFFDAEDLPSGLRYIVGEYSQKRDNLFSFVLSHEKALSGDGSLRSIHVGNAAMLGFLLHERAEGNNWLAEQALDAGPV